MSIIHRVIRRILPFILVAGCVSIVPRYPDEFARAALKKQLKMILEWGSLQRIEGGPVVIDKIDIEWMKGKISNSGFKLGPFGKHSEESVRFYSYRVRHSSGLQAQTRCEITTQKSGHGYGNVSAESERRRISCLTKERDLSYNLQLSAAKGFNYSGALTGNGLDIQVKSNMFNQDGREFGTAMAWDFFQKNTLIGSLGRGFEPIYMYMETNRITLLLTAVIVGAMKIAPE